MRERVIDAGFRLLTRLQFLFTPWCIHQTEIDKQRAQAPSRALSMRDAGKPRQNVWAGHQVCVERGGRDATAN
jgi:hypothetical protein